MITAPGAVPLLPALGLAMAQAHGNAGSTVGAGPASSLSSSSQSTYHDNPLNAVAHAQAIPLPSSSGSGGGGLVSTSSRPYQPTETSQAYLPQTYQHGRSVSDASTAYSGHGQSARAAYPSSATRHQQPTGQTGAYDFNAQPSGFAPQLDIRRQRASLPQSQPGEWYGSGQRDTSARRSVEGLGLGGIHMPQPSGPSGTASNGAARAPLGSSPSSGSMHGNAIFGLSGGTPAAASYPYAHARQYPEVPPQSYQNSPRILQHQLSLGDGSGNPSPLADQPPGVQGEGASSAGPAGLVHGYALPSSTLQTPLDPSQGPSPQPPTTAPGFYLYQPSRPVQQSQIDPSLGASQTSGLYGPSPVATSGSTFPGYASGQSGALDAFAYATPPTTASSSTSSPPREQALSLSRSLSGLFTVQSAYPSSGPTGTPVAVTVSVVAHEPHVVRGFKVVFGRHSTTTRVTSEKRYPDGEVVDLVATTPMLHLASGDPASSSLVGLQLHALDGSGNVVDWADIGQFDYTDASSSGASGSGFRMQKRPGSPLSSSRESPQHPSRATFTDGMSPTLNSVHSRNSSIGSLVNGFGHLGHHSRNSSLASAGSDSMAYSHSSSSRPLSSSQRSSLSSTSRGDSGSASLASYAESDPPEGTAERAERKPIARLRAATTSASSTAASSALRHPPIDPNAAPTAALYRSAQITSHPDQGVDLTGLTDQASLQFEGNLDLMAMGWSQDEWVAKRRLVLFTRRQVGQTIIANFRPVELGELSENSIVISCIFREDKNECFVTSVDTIYLLEALVAVRFTVEEKNRIRRNLEGFKPITVTKAKAESEDFFKLIMAFPNPKPRNIEKDVKVFPWKTLGPALQKIISKYSASYVPPETITTPGRPVPQPIGWAPGRTPPPSSEAPSVDGSAQSTPSSLSAELQDVLHRPGAPSLATVPEHPRSSSSASSHTITPQPAPPGLPSSLGAYPGQLPSGTTYPFSQEHARYTDGGMPLTAGDNFNPAYRYP